VTAERPPGSTVPGGVVLSGEVTDFDEQVGLGTVAGVDGRSWLFHCTQIADGTRRIAVGARVSFEVVPGRLGAWEAGGLRPEPA
jgi:cold shock CspA family protein